jgi:hypothetical protein
MRSCSVLGNALRDMMAIDPDREQTQLRVMVIETLLMSL